MEKYKFFHNILNNLLKGIKEQSTKQKSVTFLYHLYSNIYIQSIYLVIDKIVEENIPTSQIHLPVVCPSPPISTFRI